MPRHSATLMELAGRGAKVRLRELADEAKVLLEVFPHLRDSFDKDELPLKFIIAKGSGRLEKGNVVRRRQMSAKTRAAISAAQKARWAKQKAGETK